MKIDEKLEIVRESLGLSRAALSRALINSPSLYTNLKSGMSKGLSEVALARLFDLGVSSEWWFHASGPVFRKDAPPIVDDFFNIPLLGTIPAGLPSEAIEHAGEYVTLPKHLFAKKRRTLFALRVRGDSMTGAHITEDDIALFEYVEDWQIQTRTRDIVAAIIDGEGTLKRLYRKDHTVILKAENPKYKDITLTGNDLSAIRGKLIGIVRLYEDEKPEKND